MSQGPQTTIGWSWPRFWREFGRGYALASLWLMPVWVPLLIYCLWEMAHGR